MNQRLNIANLRPTASAASAVEDTTADATTLTTLFKALGDGLRLQIIRLLKLDSLSVSELCEVFQLRQSALSHHLKVLVQADLLVRRREGTAVFYRRQLPASVQLPANTRESSRGQMLEQILANIDAEPLDPELEQGLARVQKHREQNSLEFFRGNSERFREQRELIASWQDYSEASLHLLNRCGDLSDATLLEIGPGDGSLLPALAERAARIVALDNSETMLAAARETASTRANIRFVLGDTTGLLSGEAGDYLGQTSDAATLPGKSGYQVAMANMVLHHTPDPQSVLADASALLCHGGWLVVSELCAHDQAWAREHCGDLWLGFTPEQLTAWSDEAGLINRAEVFIAQRNGFQIQVRLFQKPGH